MLITTATNLPYAMNCQGSRLLPVNDEVLDTSNQIRDEGNAWHWLSQEIYEGRIDRNYEGPTIFAPMNGVAITPMMFLHAREYLDSFPACNYSYMEFDTSWSNNPSMFQINGRADFIGFDEYSSTLYVTDGKYGYKPVKAERNWTLISHAISFCLMHIGAFPQNVVFTIYQPRARLTDGPIVQHTITGAELHDLATTITNTLSNPSDLLSTSDLCIKCNRSLSCPAYKQMSISLLDVMERAYSETMSDEGLSDQIKLLRYAYNMIGGRLEALEDAAKYRVTNGRVVSGFGLKKSYSNKTWRKGLDGEKLKSILGRDLTKPKLITPSEAKALHVPQLMLDALTEKVETGVKLVEVDANAEVNKLINK